MNLSQFTGTEQWYKHPFSKVTYTDGVKYFAEKAGAYWFIDKVLLEYLPLYTKHEFLHITLTVLGSTAFVRVTDGNDLILKKDHVEYTDCPEGEYEFFLTNDVLLLTSEY